MRENAERRRGAIRTGLFLLVIVVAIFVAVIVKNL
jgi:hypothetical protein